MCDRRVPAQREQARGDCTQTRSHQSSMLKHAQACSATVFHPHINRAAVVLALNRVVMLAITLEKAKHGVVEVESLKLDLDVLSDGVLERRVDLRVGVEVGVAKPV